MATAPPPPPLTVRRGTCYALLAYDVGSAIDLADCERRLTETRRRALRVRSRAVAYFEYRPAPLHVVLQAEPVPIGGGATAAEVAIVLYDFGAVTVTFAVPLVGPLETVIALSDVLDDAPALRTRGHALVEDLLARLGSAVRDARIAPTTEDYLVFHLETLDPAVPPAALWSTHAHQVARLLRSEPGALAEPEAAEAVAARLAYGPGDGALFDWNAAVVYAPDLEDIRTVIEFANVQLLEMRYLDAQLDLALDQSYTLVSRRGLAGFLRSYSVDVQRVARLQVDAAILFERVSSGLKIFGDQYAAKGYRLLADRFRLAEWDATILRKLQTLDSIYGKLSDRAAARRLEALEWIIVLLIAISIVLPFVVP
jgi:hypothetical protein